MAATNVPANKQTTTAPGTASGYLTFADATGFILGARAWLIDQAGANNVEVFIVSVTSTQVGVAFVSSLPYNYGRSNLASPVLYNTGSVLDQYPAQISNIAPGFGGY